MKKLLLILSASLLSCGLLLAQPAKTAVNIVVSPSRADWTYKTGESADFSIYVLHNNVKLENLTIQYEYGPEKMPAVKKGTLDLKKGEVTLKVPGMKEPGFQTVKATVVVDGVTHSNYTTIGYDPDKIQTTTTLPSDFQKFWQDALAAAAKIPLNPRMTLMPERSTSKVDVYHIEFQNNAVGSYIYGILCMPKEPGKYPALLRVPGAGVRPYAGNIGMAEKGMITLEIGIHGIPVNLPTVVYDNLRNGALAGYNRYNLDNKDEYYYKRVYVGCSRAVDFLYTLDNLDKNRIAVTGGSQGGALSITTAALDNRIKFLAAYHPALCDLTGYMEGRAGGWPHMFRNPNEAALDKKVETSRYYDVVNFARQLKVPGLYTWGYNDPTCPPTSMYAAYNVITAEKELVLALDVGHWLYPEYSANAHEWLLKKLGIQ